MPLPTETLKQLLLSTGIVKEEDFEKAKKESERTEKNIADILISRNVISQEFFADVVAKYYQVERIKLEGITIPEDVLVLLSENIARDKQAIAFAKNENQLFVAMVDPVDLETIEFLEKLTNLKVKPYLATPEELKYGFAQYRQKLTALFQKAVGESVKVSHGFRGEDLKKASEEISIVALVDNLVSYAASLNASDIHLEALEDEVLTRFRIDGLLREISRLPKDVYPAMVARIKVLSGLQIDEHTIAQDGRFKYEKGNDVFDIRVSVIPTFFGEKIAMRLLLGAVKPLSFEELGMLEDVVKVLSLNILRSFGMILTTGPTGSGKTTTLYSVLSKLNKPEVNVITIEDPVEYNVKYVNQIQVNPKAGLDFAGGLRSIVRQDPDIIMVGEIRDPETAAIAINSALTGHLVLSTLHTNDAAGAIPRLIDMEIQPFLVAATIAAVMAQRLVRKVHLDCIESYEVSKELIEVIKQQFKFIGKDPAAMKLPKILYRGKGCEGCGKTGYSGRVGIYEIFSLNEEIRQFVQSRDFSLDGLRKLLAKYGMITMFEDGLRKAELGVTTIEEVLRVIRE